MPKLIIVMSLEAGDDDYLKRCDLNNNKTSVNKCKNVYFPRNECVCIVYTCACLVGVVKLATSCELFTCVFMCV